MEITFRLEINETSIRLEVSLEMWGWQFALMYQGNGFIFVEKLSSISYLPKPFTV